MLVKPKETLLLFASNDEQVRFEIGAEDLADISYACATFDEAAVVLTAARNGSDVADVKAKQRGNYRAYRLSPDGLQQLTDEYTSSAIPLPGKGVAYSNGKALVVLTNGQREEHKVGRFNWGPPSISSNEDGSLLALVKWKGDDRKLLLVDTKSKSQIMPSFSLYSYLLVGGSVLFELQRDIRRFEPKTGKIETLTNLSFRRALVDLCNLSSLDSSQLHFGFSNLSVLNGATVVNVQIADPETFEPHAKAIVRLSPAGAPEDIVLAAPADADWRIQAIASAGSVIRAKLGRFVRRNNFPELVETKFVWVSNESSVCTKDDWNVVGVPQVPDFGFQFLPRATIH